jgi:hypothetical protein
MTREFTWRISMAILLQMSNADKKKTGGLGHRLFKQIIFHI